ncbi:hypothetical protein CC78DRAFT_611346 [Lojkania enalia]|uniref:Uncharacterized protein n=1 Tax=Lojkania enalia TaxID=147567 RepID=A0A9P4TRH4_9PLEO|nr:hypothetical protein CC78DRAFT_611346 [Didymosphaeria enalia]
MLRVWHLLALNMVVITQLFELGNATSLQNETLQIDLSTFRFQPDRPPAIRKNHDLFSPRGLVQLFKRACNLPQPNYYCNDGDICCVDPNDSTFGWCCYGDTQCASTYISGSQCIWDVVWSTEYTSTTFYETETSTYYSNVAETTEWSTSVSTSIIVVTKSDVDTSTVFETVVVTATEALRLRRDAPSLAQRTSNAMRPPHPKATLRELLGFEEKQLQHLIPPQVTPTPTWHPRRLFKRQTEGHTYYWTTTSTIYDTETDTDWTTSYSYYTETSYTTSTYTSTSIYALSAETTVTSTTTSTWTSTPGQTAPPPSTTTDPPNAQDAQNNQQQPQDSSNGSGLSKGAQAGIGAGTAGGSLIICIILAFFLRSRRKKRKAEVAQMINDAVTAATTAARSPPLMSENQLPKAGYVAAGPIPSPPPQSSPHSVGHYSDMTLGHNNPMGMPPQGYEMSATPMPMPAPQPVLYQYPRPASPGGAHELYHDLPEMQTGRRY